MIIKKLSLTQFKNHSLQTFDFSSEINCFVGNNGVGKTNVIDALHYLSVGKSFLGNSDLNNIQNSQDFFLIDAEILQEEQTHLIKIIQSKDSRKIIKKNDKNYKKISDHIGFLPSVTISPYDSNLISDSGESRRKFLDGFISQIDSEYLHSLVQYQKALKQRNALLKSFAKNNYFDAFSLEIYNEPLQKFGDYLYRKRKDFIAHLLPVFQYYYQVISNGNESVEILYQSSLHESEMNQLLEENLAKDRILTYTSKGIHKDDLVFQMKDDLIKNIGSQGQQKSFLIALKLAQMNLLKQMTGKTPILLLDDIFDKLDDHRVSYLIDLVSRERFGQIFITDTHRERTEKIVKNITENSRVFEIINH